MLTASPARSLSYQVSESTLCAVPSSKSYYPLLQMVEKWCRELKKPHSRLQGKPNVQLKIETENSGKLR